jgi:hypothetical protein
MEEWIKRIAAKNKARSNGPDHFVDLCQKDGLLISYPETFKDIYYYGLHKNKAKEELLEEV